MTRETLSMIALVLAAIPAVLTVINLLVYRRLRSGMESGTAISVLIPARNEEMNIRAAMTSVLANQNVNFELIILDDHSTDATPHLVREMAAKDPRIRLEQAPPLPEGWCGKQHACHVLARHAKHPLLVFVDADVRLAPDALSRMAAFMDGADAPALASGFPRQMLGTFSERLLLPMIHFVLLGWLPMHFMKWTRRPGFSAGCGQLFIARRDAYRETGGHSMIRTSLHDGVKLPRLFRAAGFSTGLFDATDLATCRMYHSHAEVWSGLGKNATEGLGAPGAIVPMTLLLVGGQVLPFVLLATTPVPSATVIAACWLAWLPRLIAVVKFRHPMVSALLHPLGICALLLIQWLALFRRLRGKPSRWKNRDYQAAGASVLLALLPFASHADAGEVPRRIDLPDQHDKRHVIAFPAGHVTVISLSDRHGREQAGEWIPALRAYRHRVAIHGIADAKGTPAFMRSGILKRIREAHEEPLLIDWSGEVSESIGYRPRVANLLILGRDGSVLHRAEGPPSERNLEMFLAVLDHSLARKK